MIGHSKEADYYEDNAGNVWAYLGTKKEHWKNRKYWRKY
jgi:hypothetical protein